MQFDIFLLDYNINQQLKIAHSSSVAALLCVGKIQKIAESLDAILLQRCGVQKQHDLPLAAIDAIASGKDGLYQFWRAAPVSLSLLRDSFALEQKVTLTATEINDLTVLFCQFFAPDGLHFSADQHGGWLVQREGNWVLKTHHLHDVLGRNIAQFQATGQDANKLRSLQNQLQMLLHNHPINLAREVAGLPVCNSLWLYGGGKLPLETSNLVDYFVGESEFVKSFATISAKPVLSINKLEGLLESKQKNQQTKIVIVLKNDAEIDQLESMLKTLKLNKPKQLNLYFNMHDEAYCLRYQPQDAWKFWRKTKPFEAYFT